MQQAAEMGMRGVDGHGEDDVLLSQWPDINEYDIDFISNKRQRWIGEGFMVMMRTNSYLEIG